MVYIVSTVTRRSRSAPDLRLLRQENVPIEAKQCVNKKFKKLYLIQPITI